MHQDKTGRSAFAFRTMAPLIYPYGIRIKEKSKVSLRKKLKTVTNQYLKIQCTWEGNKSKESGYFHLISPSTR